MAYCLEKEVQHKLSSLDELLSLYGLERKDLERKCPARDRLKVTEHLGDWKMVGRYLNIDPQKLDDIDVENHTQERRRVALLDAWDEKEGERATYLKLAEAFHHRKRTDLVEKLCEIIKSHGSLEDVQDQVHSDIPMRHTIQLLHNKMISLLKQLRCELEKMKIKSDDLLDEITCLPVALKTEYKESVQKEIANIGDKGSSVSQLVRLIINPVTTFLDYKLLEYLISTFGSSLLKQDMANYVDVVDNFKRETTVAELMDHWGGIEDQSGNFTELLVHFDDNPKEFTLEKLDKRRKKICSQYKLTELVMILIRLEPGSIITVWRIPTVLVGNVTESVIQKGDRFFDAEKILSISVAGRTILPVSSYEPTDFPKLTKSPDTPDNGVVPVTPDNGVVPVTPGNGVVPVTTGNGVSPVIPGNEASLPLVSEHVPLCTSSELGEEDVDFGPAGDESMDTLYSLSAWVPRNVIWRERKELRVKFLNIIPPDWTYDGREMNTGNIMDWANRWSYLGNGIIPKFVHVRGPSAPSDIRVQFTSNGRNESKIGNKAKKVKDSDPTMWLCLGYADDDYNEHLVIHEFGHALGLGHEHQRSDFWKHIKPYIDVDKMKTDLSVSDARFCRDWGKDKKSKKGTCTPDYDPQSIMHYWFKKEWLKNGYSSKSKVNADSNLSDKERKALLGVHERHGLAKSPSEMDIRLLKDLYIGVAGDMDNESDEGMEVEGGGPQDPSGGPQDPQASAPDEDMCDLETLPNDPIWDTKPTLGYLHLLKWYDSEKKELRLFKELAPNWEVIAGILQLSDPVIKIIKMNNSVDLSGCIRDVISKWLSNGSRLPQAERFTVNWRGFYYLLLDSEESDKAILLKDALSAKKSNIRKTFK